MGNFGGILIAAALALTACAAPAPAADAPVIRVAAAEKAPAAVQQGMLDELRPMLRSLNASDADLVREGFDACAALLVTDKDAYREVLLKHYGSDLTLGLDHLTVAAAAKKYLCP